MTRQLASFEIGIRGLLATIAAMVVALAIAVLVGCSGAPELRSGGIEGTIVVRTPQGPLTIEAGTSLVISAPSDGYSVEGYELRAVAVLSGGLAGESTSLEVKAHDRCVVVTTIGAINLSAPVPGTACGSVEDKVDKPTPAPEVAAIPNS